MEDMSYLDERQEEAGGWPDEDTQTQIANDQNDDIDADPRPDSAKPAETWYNSDAEDSDE